MCIRDRWDVVERHARAHADRLFLTDNTTSLTFGDLHDRALALAVGLHRRGLRAGDRVTVQLPNWTEFVVIAAAVWRLGAVLVPILPIYRRDEVGYILSLIPITEPTRPY